MMVTEFGPKGNADIIKCGSYTGTGAAGHFVDLGFEPQWLLTKRVDSANSWYIVDNMRGFTSYPATSYSSMLKANVTQYENQELGGPYWQQHLTPTGFEMDTGGPSYNASGGNYIYVAIRRPTAEPTSATDVFAIDNEDSGSFNNPPLYISGFPVDFALRKQTNSSANWAAVSRLTGTKWLRTNDTSTEDTVSSYKFDFQDGWSSDAGWNGAIYSWMWKRAPNFCDVVTFKGTGSDRTLSHNLGVAPEMMWVKNRGRSDEWVVYTEPTTKDKILMLHSTNAAAASNMFNNTAPTAANFTLKGDVWVNGSGYNYIAYLFASLDGISKVGSYTGNGSSTGDTQTIDCGFSSGARFVLIKRTSGTGEWFVFDTERGIVSGSDAYLTLHSNAAQVSGGDYIDPDSSGFTVVQHPATEINTNGATYIFYAIA